MTDKERLHNEFFLSLLLYKYSVLKKELMNNQES